MGKGLRIIMWIFAIPFIFFGFLWLWRGARSASALGVKVGTSTGKTQTAAPANGTSAKTQTAAPVASQSTVQQVTSTINAAKDLLSTIGGLIPSNDDYTPDSSEVAQP